MSCCKCNKRMKNQVFKKVIITVLLIGVLFTSALIVYTAYLYNNSSLTSVISNEE